MPIYEFFCPACGHRFEVLVRGGSSVTCPACGSSAVDKCVSLPQAQGKSAGIIKRARQRAAAQGHLSHFSSEEIKRRS